MTSLKSIQDYLSKKPWKKAKDVARYLGCTRKSVNSVLYYNSNLFQKNLQHEWALINTQSQVPAIADMAPVAHQPETTVIVEDIDLVERIKDLLKVHFSLEVRDITDQLNEPRQLVNRTLLAYSEVFEKTDDDKWFIRGDYEDDFTGPDADFDDIEKRSEPVSNLPLVDFEEADKPPQQAVIEARLDRNFLILAPPGTGKTHTLIERMVYVITKSYQDIDPGKLLVLSFTRAAVAEVRDRIAKAIANGAPPGLRYVRVRTFDSYATWILSDGDYDIANKKYDARIQLLTTELQQVSLRQRTERIARSRYLFVDEIQDLVGVRADMVFELIKRILTVHGSVTLFGDPHQSLNDYQISGDNQTDSAEFLEKVQNFLSGRLQQFELEESHRYETAEMKSLAVDAKNVLDSTTLSASKKFKVLVEFIPEISQEQLIEQFDRQNVDVLLCRTNKEIFQWVNWLEERGNQCTVNPGANGSPWPAWIGATVMHYQPNVITRDHFLCRMNDINNTKFICKKEDLDNLLGNERLLRANTINLQEMAFRIKYFSPASKGDGADKDLMVSTIHKAKGLEYENVVVVEPYSRDISEELVRILYVAITRAKRGIFLLRENSKPFNDWLKPLQRSRLKPKRCQYKKDDSKFFQVIGISDFEIDTLFILPNGAVDTNNLEYYLSSYHGKGRLTVEPELCHQENDHDYALYLNTDMQNIRLCAAGHDLKVCLDSMSFGGKYGKDGVMLDLGENNLYQTIVHPLESPTLSRYIGPAGIMVFPQIQGFYPLSRATGE